MIFFPRISMFPEAELRATLRFLGNKINCFRWDQSFKIMTLNSNDEDNSNQKHVQLALHVSKG